ncbi:MAG: hypothetical protein MZV70_47150, partial [Desulfobacterales bacterium]|nr:hypothetical protein [Desulfobacterales bacterium]
NTSFSYVLLRLTQKTCKRSSAPLPSRSRASSTEAPAHVTRRIGQVLLPRVSTSRHHAWTRTSSWAPGLYLFASVLERFLRPVRVGQFVHPARGPDSTLQKEVLKKWPPRNGKPDPQVCDARPLPKETALPGSSHAFSFFQAVHLLGRALTPQDSRPREAAWTSAPGGLSASP